MKKIAAGMLAFIILTSSPVWAGVSDEDFGIPDIRGSVAYKNYLMRPTTELSKLLFLLERLSEAKFQVLYAKAYYDVDFVAPLARWFLKYRYTNQTAEKWIALYCSTTVLSRERIWVRLENKKFVLSRDVLMDELRRLEKTYSEDKAAGKIKEAVAGVMAVAPDANTPDKNPANSLGPQTGVRVH